MNPAIRRKRRDGRIKYQIDQLAALIKVSILKATHSETVCSFYGEKAGIIGDYVQTLRIGGANRTAPIEAGDIDIGEPTSGVAEARHWQF